jgi:hypothetical protein
MQKALFVLNIAVRAAFIILGVLILIGKVLPESQYPQLRLMMGIVFILYGIFRLVTMFARTGPAE